ncbi:MAG: diguanylate cyclase [Dongiaceae bacterium]
MMFPIPPNETERLAELLQYRILDTDPEDAFDRVTRLAAKVMGAPIALVSFVDKDRQWSKSRYGLEADETGRASAFCAHAIMESKIMVVDDATADPRFRDNPHVVADPSIRFYAGAPLRSPKGNNLGTLCIMDKAPRTLSREDQGLLADLAAVVMDEVELRSRASTDSLTGVLNRRYFDEIGAVEFRRSKRYGHAFSVVMLDVDSFKSVNDRFGHATGDEALRQVAQKLRQGLREHDILARYGGEEFVVLLTETTPAHAAHIAERLRQRAMVELHVGSEDYRITSSAGLASQRDSDKELADIIARADAALFRAKAEGRDRVVNSDAFVEDDGHTGP